MEFFYVSGPIKHQLCIGSRNNKTKARTTSPSMPLNSVYVYADIEETNLDRSKRNVLCSPLEGRHEEVPPSVLHQTDRWHHWTSFPRMPFYSGYATNDRMSVFKKEIVTKLFCKKRLHFPAFIGRFPLPIVVTIVHLNPPAGGKSL